MPTMRYTSEDGLMTSSDPRLVALWEEIGRRKTEPQERWNTLLRGLGVKLVHRDDATDDMIVATEPELSADPEPGDLIALGDPMEGYRIVALTEVAGPRLHYVDHGHRLPERTSMGRVRSLLKVG